MFETIEELISIIACGAVVLSTLSGLVASVVKNCKNKKLAKIAETTNEIAELATDKVVEAEKLFSQASAVLKAVGVKTGEIKKESVMSYIESQCAEKKIKFDSVYWSDRVEKLVKLLNASRNEK